MESKICMNASCKTTTSREWKKGWSLRSAGFADLCYNCGSAYENSVFCDMFHKGETGWRDCSICGKSVHCGCIVSVNAFEHLDFGGIGCVSCAKNSQPPLIQTSQFQNGFGTLNLNNVRAFSPTYAGKRMVNNVAGNGNHSPLCKIAEIDGANLVSQSHGVEMLASVRKLNGEGPPAKDFGKIILNATPQSVVPSYYAKTVNDTSRIEVKEVAESLPRPSLSISLGSSPRNPSLLPTSSDIKSEVKVSSSFHQGQRSLPILPKPQKAGSSVNTEANKSTAPHIPIARPPADGRGKTQLLPRYWPRISDQELQQISGKYPSFLNQSKVLSASDAGRIGRLVLPKACAEAYFPHISQSEGIPLKIQDIKGKEWTFQFRFWPNNNSRMYVLEGVTPCIQSMQLQAGDTVIFSRRDPGGKLVIGSRKASNSTDTKDPLSSDMPNGNRDPQSNAQVEHSLSAGGNIRQNGEINGIKLNGEPQLQPVLNLEKKKTRNIGSKGKRLLMHSQDALELRLTWEEAQDLLCPPPSVKPSIVVIEDLEFEEYDEAPVFGKRTIFTARESGEQDQWAQCDECSKWRKLPVDVLLPPKWTCSDNVWDPSRCSCSATDELNPKELDHLFRMCKDFKKRKSSLDSHTLGLDCMPSGLDALASAAVLGDSMGEPGEASEASIGATTRHPRHRPGCTCIVCIQPPSGKGKHKSSCTCNVCMTVKRRFKTLMLRKKKRQSERELETSQKDHNEKDGSENNGTSKHASLSYSENGENSQKSRINLETTESSNGRIDLNCDPDREDMQLEETGLSMMSLVQAASSPLENNHEKQNGSASSNHDEQAKTPSPLPSQMHGESERALLNEGSSSSSVQEHHSTSNEGNCEDDLDRNK